MTAGKRVLLIEDNPDDVVLARRALAKASSQSQLLVASSGPEALAFFFERTDRSYGPLPDLTLLDLKLPGLGGLNVLRRIRADPSTSMLPVVVFTTSRERQDIANAYALGANSYIIKPVQFDKFVDLMRDLLTYWLVLNESPLS